MRVTRAGTNRRSSICIGAWCIRQVFHDHPGAFALVQRQCMSTGAAATHDFLACSSAFACPKWNRSKMPAHPPALLEHVWNSHAGRPDGLQLTIGVHPHRAVRGHRRLLHDTVLRFPNGCALPVRHCLLRCSADQRCFNGVRIRYVGGGAVAAAFLSFTRFCFAHAASRRAAMGVGKAQLGCTSGTNHRSKGLFSFSR